MIGVQKTVVYLNNLQELTVRFSKKLLVRFSKTDLQCVCVCNYSFKVSSSGIWYTGEGRVQQTL